MRDFDFREVRIRLNEVLLSEYLAQLRSHHDGDPYHVLLHALGRGTVVVFDVETHHLPHSFAA